MLATYSRLRSAGRNVLGAVVALAGLVIAFPAAVLWLPGMMK